MFIKRGDGKITTIINDSELSDEQKKSAEDLSKKDKKSDSSSKSKKSGDNNV